jgi:hypothetical protein
MGKVAAHPSFKKFHVFSLGNREITPETGSLQTACTASQSVIYPREKYSRKSTRHFPSLARLLAREPGAESTVSFLFTAISN